MKLATSIPGRGTRFLRSKPTARNPGSPHLATGADMRFVQPFERLLANRLFLPQACSRPLAPPPRLKWSGGARWMKYDLNKDKVCVVGGAISKARTSRWQATVT